MALCITFDTYTMRIQSRMYERNTLTVKLACPLDRAGNALICESTIAMLSEV